MQRLEVSGAVRPICGSLGVKRLKSKHFVILVVTFRGWDDAEWFRRQPSALLLTAIYTDWVRGGSKTFRLIDALC